MLLPFAMYFKINMSVFSQFLYFKYLDSSASDTEKMHEKTVEGRSIMLIFSTCILLRVIKYFLLIYACFIS